MTLICITSDVSSNLGMSRYNTIANANCSVPLRTALKIDHLFELCCVVLS